MNQSRYVLGKVIQRGTVSTVREARDDTDRLCVKVYKSSKHADREIVALRHLSHANIIPLLDTFSNKPDTLLPNVLVLPLYQRDLFEYISGLERRIPVRDGLRIADGLLQALQHMWIKNIYHGDIKPENILITQGGVPILCDFGSAGPYKCVHNGPYTVEYRSPQTILGGHICIACDVWSWGCVFFDIFTGVRMFQDFPLLKNKEHLTIISEFFGRFPLEWTSSVYLKCDGSVKNRRALKPIDIGRLLREEHELEAGHAAFVEGMLRAAMTVQCAQRPTPIKLIQKLQFID